MYLLKMVNFAYIFRYDDGVLETKDEDLFVYLFLFESRTGANKNMIICWIWLICNCVITRYSCHMIIICHTKEIIFIAIPKRLFSQGDTSLSIGKIARVLLTTVYINNTSFGGNAVWGVIVSNSTTFCINVIRGEDLLLWPRFLSFRSR